MGDEHWSIGELAQRSGLTARALRIYDDAGILVPAAVDDATGYRWYAPSQLDRARLIAALRSAGVPLATVREIVDADVAEAHVLVDRWWRGVRAEHDASGALVPRIHHLLDGRSPDVHDERPTSAGVGRWEAAVRAVLRADLDSLDHHLAAAPELLTQRGPEGRTLLADAARAVTNDHALPGRDAGDAHHAVVARLLDAGAPPSAPDANGWTPLHSAAISGNLRLARALLDAGASVDAVVDGIGGATPLSFALFYGHVATAEAIAGERPVPDDLRTAAALGDVARLRRWLDGGRPLPADGFDFCGPPDWFPPRVGVVDDQVVLDESLVWAARSGQIGAMALLVEHGADVNASPYRGTPLVWAVYADRADAVTWLLDHGADPDLRHDFGGAGHGVAAVALHLAAQYGSVESMRVLLAHGADATITDGAHESTPLGWARFGEQPEAIALLEAHVGG